MRARDIALTVFIVFAILIALIAVYRYLYQGRIDSFSEKCLDQSGHIYRVENNLIFCLTTDGRVIEVFP